jgi:hypothetical protein
MSGRNYYCLIAGLPDIIQDDKKLHFSSVRLKEYLREELHLGDFKLVALFYLPFDHQNMLNLLYKKEKPWDERGNLTEGQLEQIIQPKLFEVIHRKEYPPCFIRFGQLLRSREEVEEKISYEGASHFLTSEYFQALRDSGNDFIREVADYRLYTGNILLALNGRKHDLPFEDALIGNDPVTQALKKNRTRDFGLSVDYPDIEPLIQLFDNENILDRELKFDQRQWNFLEDITFFHYFTVERVLSFVLKVFLAERWFHLDYEKGQVMFNQLLNEIESSFEFPEEFSHTYGKKR